MPLTLNQVRRRFPEAQETYRGFGNAFLVHCWQPHRTGGRYEMEINAESGFFHCHNCGHNGNAFNEFFDRFEEEFLHLYSYNRNDTSDAPAKSTIRRGSLIPGTEIESPGEMTPFSGLPGGHPAVEYLRDRGFDIDELRNLDPARALWYCSKGQLSFIKGMGTTSGRLIFPVYMAGKFEGWQARQIERTLHQDAQTGEKEVWNGSSWKKFKKIDGQWQDRYVPKYYTSPGMRRSSVLYNFDMARNFGTVAVAEGPLDVQRVGPQCVATLGKEVTPDQIRLLKTYWSRVIILRDPEIDPKEKKFQRILSELSPLEVFHLALEDGKDPGATPRESTWRQIQNEIDRHRSRA